MKKMQVHKPRKVKDVQPKSYRLISHSFFVELLMNNPINSPHISNPANQALKLGIKPDISFTQKEAYCFNINYYLTNISTTIERMEQVTIFVRRFPSSSYFKEKDINIYSWIKYHYSNFLIMSISLFDISLLLTNEVLMLGIEPHNCRWGNISKQKVVKETNIKDALENLFLETKEYRTGRNLLAHQGKTPDLGFMELINDYEFFEKSEKILGKKFMPKASLDNPFPSPFFRSYMFRSERKKLVSDINKKIDLYIDLLLVLFDAQMPFYKIVLNKLES